jgi:hypothetical protein
MGEFLVRVVDAFELESPHPWGRMLERRLRLAPRAASGAVPARRRTRATAVPLKVGDPLKEWVEAPDLEPYRRIDGRQVVTAAMGTLERYQPTETAREDYLVSYQGERFAESMRYVQTYPTELPVLRDLLPEDPDPSRSSPVDTTPSCRWSTQSFSMSASPGRLEKSDVGHFIRETARPVRGADNGVVGRWLRNGRLFDRRPSRGSLNAPAAAVLWRLTTG